MVFLSCLRNHFFAWYPVSYENHFLFFGGLGKTVSGRESKSSPCFFILSRSGRSEAWQRGARSLYTLVSLETKLQTICHNPQLETTQKCINRKSVESGVYASKEHCAVCE